MDITLRRPVVTEATGQARPARAAFVGTLVVVALVWAATAVRVLGGIELGGGDQGTFLSVAERLRAGDRLYVDVWDNKEPFFFYALALLRAVTPYAALVLDLLALVLSSAAGYAVLRSLRTPTVRSLLAAGSLTPLVLTGVAYAPGMTHLPATALVLVAVAAALRDRWATAGALLVVAAMFKVLLLPVGVAAVVALAVARGRAARLWRSVVAGLGVAVATGGLLVWRGELGPFVAALRANVGYSQGDLTPSGLHAVFTHVMRVMPEGGSGAGVVTLLGLAACLVVAAPRPRHRPGPRRAALWWATVAGTLAAVLVIAGTGLWPHHTQVLYCPGLLAVLLVARRPRLGASPGPLAGLLLALLVAGGSHPYVYVQSWRGIDGSLASMRGASPEARVMATLADGGTYARLGTNDVSAHARGLGGWQLACARFHQYPFDPPAVLDATLACLDRADTVIVDRELTEQAGQPAWNAFVREARARFRSGYTCVSFDHGEICHRG